MAPALLISHRLGSPLGVTSAVILQIPQFGVAARMGVAEVSVTDGGSKKNGSMLNLVESFSQISLELY